MPDVTIPYGASTPELGGYLAVPAGDGPWPGVVVVHEIIGLNGDIRRQTDPPPAAGAGGGGRPPPRPPPPRGGGGGGAGAGAAPGPPRRWLAERDDCTGRV